MTRIRTLPAAAIVAVAILLVADTAVADPKALPPGYQKVMAVVNSAEMSKPEKVARLKAMVADDETMWPALCRLDTLAPSEAVGTAAAVLRVAETPREQKLRLWHFLFIGNRPQREGFPQELVREFASYLVDAVLDGGEREFCRKLPGHPVTAVGEYAYLASDFDGYKGVDFEPFENADVVAVLIRCLDAPDNVHAEDQGDCLRGTPGESTGRNTARQQIPVALARLSAVQAVEPLRRILDGHPDWYLRDNAAYALARLEPPADHAKLVAQLRSRRAKGAEGRTDFAKDRYYHLYACGRGLLHRGDDDGIEFMAFKYSIYDSVDGLSEMVYMLEQRVMDLRAIRSPKLEGFFRQAFNHERVMSLLMLDGGKTKANDDGHSVYDLARAAPRIEGLFDEMCRIIEGNRLASLRPTLELIAGKSASESIRGRATRCVDVLGK
ncbi:MAG: hypothetical protein JXL80_02350 [Planctomycetes bacterium]|nr:hypothetical protein [Planctomycetota bacterium]